jgi:UDP-N-acetylglucosamine 2-epimerase
MSEAAANRLRVLSVVGARPEFVQAAPVSRALRVRHEEILVHTGQHYDDRMSQVFFEQLGVPTPEFHLGVGSGSHGRQTGAMLAAFDEVLDAVQPDVVLVRGDTNSTLAGALAASKRLIPVAHIEAGERSFDRRMPEEQNRIVADHLSQIRFCVSAKSAANLAREGIAEQVHVTGDVMLDALLQHRPAAQRISTVLQRLDLLPGSYALVTVHRAANTDDPARLLGIVDALNAVESETVVFPVHPRTQKALAAAGVRFAPHVRTVEPAGYFDMMMLEANARLIATDSGGVQREAYYLCRPCLTLRDETEWTETVDAGWNRLVGADPRRILEEWFSFAPPAEHPPVLGDGSAAERIVRHIEAFMATTLSAAQPRAVALSQKVRA